MADTQELSDKFEIVSLYFISELLCSFVLFLETYFIYKGIEIEHPVYAVIFCDLIVTLVSSLINVVVLPFASNDFRFTALANGNSVLCLHFHCCCWVVLSVLRYLYIVKEKWLDEKLLGSRVRLLVAFAALAALFLTNVTSVLGIVVYFGYPEIRVMDLALSQKLTAMAVILANLIGMIMTSCLCYFQILRQKGHLMNNSVDVGGEASSGIFVVYNVNRRETLEMEAFERIQNETMLRKREAEMTSAVVSLKTNLIYILVIILIFLLATYLSNDVFGATFSSLKSLAPVITSIINFGKIQALMKTSLEAFLDKFRRP